MTAYTAVPDPNECHPALLPMRESALSALMSGVSRLRYPIPHPPVIHTETDAPEIAEIRTATMERRKAVGPAPYVGRPFVYRWDALEDELGRCIAGPARIHYILESEWFCFLADPDAWMR